MTNANNRVTSNSWCLTETNDEVIVMYVHDGGTAAIDTTFPYQVFWYDPRNGGVLQFGSKTYIKTGSAQELGTAPNNPNMDWTVLLRKCPDCLDTSSEEGGTETGLIVGLVAGSVVLLAIVIYLGILQSRRQSSRSSNKKPAKHSPAPPFGFVDDPIRPSNSPSRRDPPASTSESRSSIGGQTRSVESNSMTWGPVYKDQVRTSSMERPGFIPTVAAMEVDQSEIYEEAQGEYCRVEM